MDMDIRRNILPKYGVKQPRRPPTHEQKLNVRLLRTRCIYVFAPLSFAWQLHHIRASSFQESIGLSK